MSSADDDPVKPSSQWKSVDTSLYDAKWAAMERDGQSVHGEADFVCRFSPTTVLDGGCGTGRVAIELARRGCDVVGVDLDAPMISAAQAKAPEIDFQLGDLATIDLQQTFDVVALPGNVMIFVAPGSEPAVVQNMAQHLDAGGRLIAGFQLARGLDVASFDEMATSAGLSLEQHWCTWDAKPPHDGADYALLVYRKLPE